MYTLKSTLKRGASLGSALALAIATMLPAAAAYADALNPLTERSLTLSSSAPGYESTDGSGNSTYASPNSGANGQKTGNTFSFKTSSNTTTNKILTMTFQYCDGPAGDCTSPGNNGYDTTGGAGNYTRNPDSTTTSDLNVTTSSPSEVSSANFDTVVDTSGTTTHPTGTGTVAVDTSGNVTGDGTAFQSQLSAGMTVTIAGDDYVIDGITSDTAMTLTTSPATAIPAGTSFTYTVTTAATGDVTTVPEAGIAQEVVPGTANNTISGNYVVYYYDTGTDEWTQSTGWTMSTANVESGTVGDGKATGAQNYIILTSASGMGFAAGTQVKVVFFANDSNYITNPGDGAFYVKINTYNKQYVASSPGTGQVDLTGLAPASDDNIIDGGVTVANVMNHSIQITTKVLETMEFSVGTVDPDTLQSNGTTTSELYTANQNKEHGICDPILTGMTYNGTSVNVLQLGNQSLESSLATDHTYSTHSYWRLSSNSSAGATVYYSGVSLSNTVGDIIDPIGATKKAPHEGSEQFGLALTTDNTATDGDGNNTYATVYNSEENSTTGAFEHGADSDTVLDTTGNGAALDTAGLAADNVTSNASWHSPKLYPLVPATNYNQGAGIVNSEYGTPNTEFAFDPTSNLVPVPLATENNQVVDCVTGRMRYIANIAATTPAGIYTTKVNYIAAPQY